jgi:hypothetical protein
VEDDGGGLKLTRRSPITVPEDETRPTSGTSRNEGTHILGHVSIKKRSNKRKGSEEVGKPSKNVKGRCSDGVRNVSKQIPVVVNGLFVKKVKWVALK